MECCDNRNIIFTNYYVCTNCAKIIDYKYIYKISMYEIKTILIKILYQNPFIKG